MAGTDIKNANIDAVQFVIQSSHVGAADAGHARIYRHTDGWYEADENGQSFIRAAQPAARLRRTTSQTIPNNTPTLIIFDAEDYDTDDMHDNVSNPTRLTCKTAGLYLLIAQIRWFDNVDGDRTTRIKRNGTTVIAEVQDIAAHENGQVAATIYQLNANDYVEVEVVQTRGGDLGVVVRPDNSPIFIAHRIG